MKKIHFLILLFCAGTFFTILGLLWFCVVHDKNSDAKIYVKSTEEFKSFFLIPGKYDVWYVYSGIIDNITVENDKEPPSGLMVKIVDTVANMPIEIQQCEYRHEIVGKKRLIGTFCVQNKTEINMSVISTNDINVVLEVSPSVPLYVWILIVVSISIGGLFYCGFFKNVFSFLSHYCPK